MGAESLNPIAIGSMFAIFAIIASILNFVVIAAILKDKHLRSSGIYVPVLGLGLVDLLNGGLKCTVFAYNYLSFNGECGLTIAMSVMGEVFEAITMYTLCLLFLNHLMHQSTPNDSRKQKIGIIGVILIFVVCIVGLSITLTLTRVDYFNGCLLTLSRTMNIVISVVVYFLPLFLLCVAGIVMILQHSTQRYQSNGVIHENIVNRNTPFPSHLVTAGFIAAVTAGPTTILGVVPITCSYGISSCYWVVYMSIAFSFLYNAKSLILPFAWLIDSEYKMAFRRLLGMKAGNQHTVTQMMPYQPFQPQVNPTVSTNQQTVYNGYHNGYTSRSNEQNSGTDCPQKY